MDFTNRTELRRYLVTQHAPRTILELENIHWLASTLVDELQQELERLAVALESEGDTEAEEQPAKSRTRTPTE